MSELDFNILFIGEGPEAWTREVQFHCLKYKNSLKFNFCYLNNLDLGLNKLNKIKPQVIIVDLDIDCPKYNKILTEYKQIYYNYPLLMIGVIKNIESNSIFMGQNLLLDGLFQKCTKNDENIFLSRMIIDFFKNNELEKGLFSVARVQKTSSIEIPVFCKTIDFKKIVIESSCKFEFSQAIDIQHPLINRFNWAGKKNKHRATFIKTEQALANYSYEFDLELLRDSEFLTESNDIKKTIPTTLNEEDRNYIFNNLFEKRMIELELLKKHSFQSWVKKNRHDYIQDTRQNVLIICSDLELKLKKDLVEFFKLYRQPKLNPVQNAFLDKKEPSIIFYEIEKLVEFLDPQTQVIHPVADKAYIYNNLKTLQELRIKLNNKNRNSKICIFNNDINLSKDIIKTLPEFNGTDWMWIDGSITDLAVSEVLKQLQKECKSELELIKPDSISYTLYTNDLSNDLFATIELPILIEFLTESEIIISSENELPENKLLVVNGPFKLPVYIMPDEKLKTSHKSKIKHYRGFICGLNADQRDDLRSFVINYTTNAVA